MVWWYGGVISGVVWWDGMDGDGVDENGVV